jgi:hypothetical protein
MTPGGIEEEGEPEEESLPRAEGRRAAATAGAASPTPAPSVVALPVATSWGTILSSRSTGRAKPSPTEEPVSC